MLQAGTVICIGHFSAIRQQQARRSYYNRERDPEGEEEESDKEVLQQVTSDPADNLYCVSGVVFAGRTENEITRT